MSNSTPPPSLHDLGSRIAKARRDRGLAEPERSGESRQHAGGLGLGMRISIEIVTALAVSTGLGWVFDQWWGTTPWAMLVMLVLGFAAGINNAVRAANRLDAAAARDRADTDAGHGGDDTGAKGGD
jgi:ATP synthase protein I